MRPVYGVRCRCLTVKTAIVVTRPATRARSYGGLPLSVRVSSRRAGDGICYVDAVSPQRTTVTEIPESWEAGWPEAGR